ERITGLLALCLTERSINIVVGKGKFLDPDFGGGSLGRVSDACFYSVKCYLADVAGLPTVRIGYFLARHTVPIDQILGITVEINGFPADVPFVELPAQFKALSFLRLQIRIA